MRGLEAGDALLDLLDQRHRIADHALLGDLLFDDGRLIMQNSRFTQFGSWAGWFSINGKRHAVDGSRTRGARDKSWGVRPVGEPEGGAPGLMNG